MPLKSYDAFPAWSVDCMAHVKAVLSAPENQVPLLDLITDAEGHQKLTVREGRPVPEDSYPCLAIELLDDDDPFVAGGYSREVTVNLNIIACIKTAGGSAHPQITEREKYIGRLTAVAKAILNRPQNLQFPFITTRGDSNFDSGAGKATYGYLHGGAVRAGQFPWFCKFWVSPVGPDTAAL